MSWFTELHLVADKTHAKIVFYIDNAKTNFFFLKICCSQAQWRPLRVRPENYKIVCLTTTQQSWLCGKSKLVFLLPV